jgi:ABC-2 type transport system ATP-binding protein
LLQNTPIVLFDEPTAGLDPGAAADFRALLRDKLSRKEGKTIMVSTHNLNEAEGICDRIAILNRGKILACDTPQKVQHMVFDKKILTVSLSDSVSIDTHAELLKQLRSIPEIKEITPETDLKGNIRKLNIDMNKEANISGILSTVVSSGLAITSINTEEPSLEDVFMSLTRGHQEPGKQPDRPGDRTE